MAFINHSQLTISYVSGNHCKIINICLLVLFIFISNYQKRFCPPIYSSFLTLLESKRTITTILFYVCMSSDMFLPICKYCTQLIYIWYIYVALLFCFVIFYYPLIINLHTKTKTEKKMKQKQKNKPLEGFGEERRVLNIKDLVNNIYQYL